MTVLGILDSYGGGVVEEVGGGQSVHTLGHPSLFLETQAFSYP